MIFETHAHYEDRQFDEDREKLLLSMQANGISKVVNVGSTAETTKKSVELAEKYDFIYASAGIHPSEIRSMDEETLAWISRQAEHPKVIAIGEIGLDYYWDKEVEIMEKQRYWFRKQLQAAVDKNLPVIIHSRDAASDTLEIMREAYAQHVSGVIHCFSYSAEIAQQFVNMGFYIGIGGVVTFKNAKKVKEAVKKIPMEKILLETDCPYMAPEPHRGKRNSSLYLPYVAEKIAEIKEITAEEVIRQTEINAEIFYRFTKKG